MGLVAASSLEIILGYMALKGRMQAGKFAVLIKTLLDPIGLASVTNEFVLLGQPC